ncbi:hypothetical protein O6R05_03215 [Peptoniphilus equinus]|uniref:Prepilin-type N-terminal cleavage/methylation domain-containing protein n=1 Tax=Peptoniphilus equinus TaxID=3016343 RepID=A0ABY7QUV9_9FIRM|nr:hypothetical protein [Peptoniphilus equinus]WBW50568.1 hypothetical protein O6R05_03215 [Peptoniphilus equinus]
MSSKKLSTPAFTLIELTVSMGLLVLVMSVIGGVLFATLKSSERLAVLDNGQSELYFFERYVRQEVKSAEGVAVIGGRLTLGFDKNENGAYGREVHYHLSGRKLLKSTQKRKDTFGNNVLLDGVAYFTQTLKEGFVTMEVTLENNISRRIEIDVTPLSAQTAQEDIP